MGEALAARLQQLEGDRDVLYRVEATAAARPSPCAGPPVYCADLKPQAIPAWPVWLQLVKQRPEAARRVATCARQERARVGLTWNRAAGHWDLDQQRLFAALERDAAAVEKHRDVLRDLGRFRDLHGRDVWPDAFAGRRGLPDFQEAKLAQRVARVAQTYSQDFLHAWERRTCGDWLSLAGFGGEMAGGGAGGDDPPAGGGGGGGPSSGSGAGGGPASGSGSGSRGPGGGGPGGDGSAGGGAGGGGGRLVGGGPKRPAPEGRRPQTRGAAREEQRQKEEEDRIRGKTVKAGDVEVNVALDDVHVSEEGTLPAWLLDPAPRVAGRCVARVWRAYKGGCVLWQCKNSCKDQREFCVAHGQPEQRHFGIWDPEKHHSSLTRESGNRYDLAVREAQLREAKAGGAPPAPSPAIAAARKARVPVAKPTYVHLLLEERYPLREFKSAPEALPPFPCRLCDKNFATHACFMGHVQKEHHGWPEYRKRLLTWPSRMRACGP